MIHIIKIAIVTMLCALHSRQVHAQTSLQIDPPHWCLGMPSDSLLLMINTVKSGSMTQVQSKNPLVSIAWQKQDGDYLFLQLKLAKALKPGLVTFTYSDTEQTSQSFTYAIRARSKNWAPEGIGQADVVYLLMPDRFCDGDTTNNRMDGMEHTNIAQIDGRHGGDIPGIEAHLKYIKQLGATTIWPTPLVEMNQAQGSYHHYGSSNFYKIDTRFASGTANQIIDNEFYNRFVQTSHANGLKVIMDVVLNHIGIDHHWMKNKTPKNWVHDQNYCNFMIPALTDPYAHPADVTSMEKGWFVPTMPDLNHDNALVCQYLIQNTLWWIENSKVDALRLDTQPFSKKEFLKQWSEAIVSAYPSITIVGETWSAHNSKDYINYWQANNGNKDGYTSKITQVMNFPWFEAVTMGLKNNDANKIYYCYATDFNNNTNASKNFTMLGNHDTERFYTTVEQDNLKYEQGLLMWASLPGIPQLYYGDELAFAGKKGINDGYMRSDMPFFNMPQMAISSKALDKTAQQHFEFCKMLLLMRSSSIAWHSGTFVQRVPRNNVYSYAKSEGRTQYIFFINFNKDAAKVNLEEWWPEVQGKNVRSHLLSNNSSATKLGGQGYAVFEIR
jgi:neopullulanase